MKLKKNQKFYKKSDWLEQLKLKIDQYIKYKENNEKQKEFFDQLPRDGGK